MSNYLPSLYIILCMIKLCYLMLDTDCKNDQNKKNRLVLKNYKNIIKKGFYSYSSFENKQINSQETKQKYDHNSPLSNITNKKKKLYHPLTFTKQKNQVILRKFYHTREIYNFIDNLQDKNFDFVEVSTIGHTKQGTSLKIIKIKTNRNNDTIWIDGGTHAREWITISSLIYITNELIYNRQSLPNYMKNINFVLMPIVNPDGYTYSHEKDRLWRKNCVETFKNNCIGIDLNRNWNYDWNNTNSDNDCCSDAYRGIAPNSELEIKAIIQFIKKNLTRMKGFITLHSYGQTIMYPWAYTKANLKDYNELHSIAISMASKIFEKTANVYKVGSASSTMYQVSGTSIDWMKGKAKIKFVYALELRDNGQNGFKLSTNEIIPTGQEAFCAITVLAEHIVSKYQSGSTFCRPMNSILYTIFIVIYFLYKVM